MTRRILFPVLLVAGALAAGCQPPPPQMPPMKPPEVVVAKAIEHVVTDHEDFTGRTEAFETVELRARVSGYLIKAPFKEGDEIKKGDVLFEIDPRPLQAELERSEAAVTQAEARTKRLEADYNRARTLLARGGISQEEFDKIAGDLAEARSNIRASGAAREIAKLNLEYARVVSPINGKIGRRMIDPGNMVKADETALAYVANYDPIYAYFDVDERTYLRISRFLESQGKANLSSVQQIQVGMGLADEEGLPHKGMLNFVDNRVDQNTGSVWVRAKFDNPRQILAPGLFVRVRVPIGDAHRAVLIPERAFGTDQGQKFIYVVGDDKKAVYTPVSVGSVHEISVKGKVERWRVVDENVIKPGQRVIVSGLQRVRPNSPEVDPKEESAPVAKGEK